MKHLQIDEVVRPHASVLHVLNLEAMSLTNMVGSIKNLFPSFAQKLKDTSNIVVTIPEVKVEMTDAQEFVLKNVHVKEFMDLADLQIQTPEGFSGSYVDYSALLYEISKQNSTIIEDVLRPFSTYLSQFISNKDSKLSTRDITQRYFDAESKVKMYTARLGKFRENGTSGLTTLGKVVSRKADIAAVYSNTYLITKSLENTNLKEVQKLVDHCHALLNMIVDQAVKGSIESVTPEVARNLAYSAEHVAEEIEFIALVHFKALGFVQSVDKMTVTLSNFIKGVH
jgi:hypothetical protein